MNLESIFRDILQELNGRRVTKKEIFVTVLKRVRESCQSSFSYEEVASCVDAIHLQLEPDKFIEDACKNPKMTVSVDTIVELEHKVEELLKIISHMEKELYPEVV